MMMDFKISALITGGMLLASAIPALAQDSYCGGLSMNATWLGGDAASSDISTAGTFLGQTGLTVPPSGNLVTLFSLSAPGDVRVEAAGQADGDTVMELYDAAGTMVLTDDDSGGNWASRAETTLQPGQYCMLTRGFGGGALLADVRVGLMEHEALTQGLSGGFGGGFDGGMFVGIDPCLPGTAAMPLGGGPIDGMLASGAPGVSATNSVMGAPYYRFTLASPQSISIRAENENADPYIYIFDGQGTLLAENDDYDSLNSRIDFTAPLQPGNYCIGMRSLSDDNMPITISVRGYDAQAALNEAYASGEASPPMDGSYPMTALGPVTTSVVRDGQVSAATATWFSFNMPQSGLLVIDAVSVTDSDPVISLFDSLGREIGYNDDADGSLNSQLTLRLDAGNYTLAVRQYTDSYNGIIRVAMQRFVPAQ